MLSYTLLCVPYCPYNNFRTLNVDNFALCTLSCVYIGMTFVMKAMVFILFLLKFVTGNCTMVYTTLQMWT